MKVKVFNNLCIKVDTILDFDNTPIDWNYIQLICDLGVDSDSWFCAIDRMKQSSDSTFQLEFDWHQRDELFEKTQLFAIWEKSDVKGLIARLQQTL